jgi:hypothetical protein
VLRDDFIAAYEHELPAVKDDFEACIAALSAPASPSDSYDQLLGRWRDTRRHGQVRLAGAALPAPNQRVVGGDELGPEGAADDAKARRRTRR